MKRAFKKRRPMSEQTKLKISIANKGKKRKEPRSEETRLKLSLAHKGKHYSLETQFKKGHKFSEETKRKISIGNKGKKMSEEAKRKISLFNLGIKRKPLSEEQKKRISEFMKTRPISNETRIKMSKSRIGKKINLSEEVRKKLAIGIKKRLANQVGENHPNWKGGTSFEKYTIDWNKKLKKLIKERDNNKCVICENINGLVVHHIDYNKKNCTPENLITLCRSCHSKTNFDREQWINKFNNILKIQEQWGIN